MLDWTKEELKNVNSKTRKLITMSRSLHLRGNVGRQYLEKKEGRRGLISSEECVNVEVQQTLNKYLCESEE